MSNELLLCIAYSVAQNNGYSKKQTTDLTKWYMSSSGI